MPTSVEVPDRFAREVKRLLLLVALGGLAIVTAVAVAGFYLYRVHRFQTNVLASIEEVGGEGLDRSRFTEEVRAQLFAGDFDALEAQARALRASRETYPNGVWKLTHFYDALGAVDNPEGFAWEAAIAQAEAWTEAHPSSIAPRIVLAELWIAYAWHANVASTDTDPSPSPTDEEESLFEQRLGRADAVFAAAEEVREYCPHLAAAQLRLAVSARWPRESEVRVFDEAVARLADYQPYYGLHLYYLEDFVEGVPGEWARESALMATRPGGPERYAQTVWFRGQRGEPRLDGVSWSLLKDGFRRLVASHPDSFELKSAFCFFATQFRDVGETRRLLDEIGFRMQTTVWRDRQQFAQAHRWATFEDSERTRDPLARWFARLWR